MASAREKNTAEIMPVSDVVKIQISTRDTLGSDLLDPAEERRLIRKIDMR